MSQVSASGIGLVTACERGIEMLDAVSAAVVDAAGSPWIGLFLLLVCMGDSFMPAIPSESLVVAVGSVSVSTGDPSLWVIIPCAAAGAVAGDVTMYAVGRLIGTDRFGWMRAPRVVRAVAWARAGLDRRGALLILTGRNIPVVRVAVNLVAGAIGYPVRRYLPLAALACVLWAGYLAIVGAVAGRLTGDRPALGAAIAVAVAVVIGVGIDLLSRRFVGTPAPTAATEGAEEQPERRPVLCNRGC